MTATAANLFKDLAPRLSGIHPPSPLFFLKLV